MGYGLKYVRAADKIPFQNKTSCTFKNLCDN